jgi:hypothetical protein
MADKNKKNTEQRQRPKGYEIRESLKPNKNKDRLTDRDRELLKYKLTPPEATGSEATDPFLSRNEFKPGFYEQNAGMITPQGLYGTASGKTMFESPIVDPDTKMMQDAQGMVKGGSVMVKTKIGKNKATKLY